VVSHRRDIARVGTTGRIHIAKKNTHRSGDSVATMTGGIGNAAKRDKKMLRVCHAGKADDVLAGIAADRATDYAAVQRSEDLRAGIITAS
jgi:hypothetical protein